MREHDEYSANVLKASFANVLRENSGTQPGTQEGRVRQLHEDVAEIDSYLDRDDSLDDPQGRGPITNNTKAYRSQDYARKHPGVDTLSSDDLLRDASKRLVGSQTSVDIYRSLTPGQGGKSFADLCRDIYINNTGYTPRGGDEDKFVKLHKGYSIEPMGYDSIHDRNNDDDAFNGSTKPYDRSANRCGYNNDGEDTDAEFQATRKYGYRSDVATGKRDDIYKDDPDYDDLEEAIHEFHAKLTYDLLDDGFDVEDFEDASELACDLVEAYIDEEAICEDKGEACAMAQFLANHHRRPYFVNKLTGFGEKGRRIKPVYHAVSKKHYDNDDSRHWEYELTHIANPQMPKLKEGEEHEGRKLRQNLTAKEREALERSGSLNHKSTRTAYRKSHGSGRKYVPGDELSRREPAHSK